MSHRSQRRCSGRETKKTRSFARFWMWRKRTAQQIFIQSRTVTRQQGYNRDTTLIQQGYNWVVLEVCAFAWGVGCCFSALHPCLLPLLLLFVLLRLLFRLQISSFQSYFCPINKFKWSWIRMKPMNDLSCQIYELCDKRCPEFDVACLVLAGAPLWWGAW